MTVSDLVEPDKANCSGHSYYDTLVIEDCRPSPIRRVDTNAIQIVSLEPVMEDRQFRAQFHLKADGQT